MPPRKKQQTPLPTATPQKRDSATDDEDEHKDNKGNKWKKRDDSKETPNNSKQANGTHDKKSSGKGGKSTQNSKSNSKEKPPLPTMNSTANGKVTEKTSEISGKSKEKGSSHSAKKASSKNIPNQKKDSTNTVTTTTSSAVQKGVPRESPQNDNSKENDAKMGSKKRTSDYYKPWEEEGWQNPETSQNYSNKKAEKKNDYNSSSTADKSQSYYTKHLTAPNNDNRKDSNNSDVKRIAKDSAYTKATRISQASDRKIDSWNALETRTPVNNSAATPSNGNSYFGRDYGGNDSSASNTTKIESSSSAAPSGTRKKVWKNGNWEYVDENGNTLTSATGTPMNASSSSFASTDNTSLKIPSSDIKKNPSVQPSPALSNAAGKHLLSIIKRPNSKGHGKKNSDNFAPGSRSAKTNISTDNVVSHNRNLTNDANDASNVNLKTFTADEFFKTVEDKKVDKSIISAKKQNPQNAKILDEATPPSKNTSSSKFSNLSESPYFVNADKFEMNLKAKTNDNSKNNFGNNKLPSKSVPE